ncbi:MAG: hypothetical protein MPN21_13720 [Thermoanaerobaculia bacterium]|nr:hypothetical protein [Thermoanaerobaculia bacterium]
MARSPTWIRRFEIGCRRLIVGSFAASFLAFGAASAGAPIPPTLHFEAPPELAPQIEWLRGFDTTTLLPIMELVGLDEPGTPIRVLIVAEGSPKARLMPSWGVAYAVGNAGTVVLVPSRIPTYPDDSLSAVLRHEVAHVLVARAAGYRPVPRWFNEGLATVAGRDWSWEDRGLVMLATIPREGLTLREIDEGFRGGTLGAKRAYALSTAFVRWLLEQDGPDVAARILNHVARGDPFEEAFQSATGRSLEAAERAYWSNLNFWNRWVPILGSSGFLWIVITLLALYAFKRRKERDEEQRSQWAEEEDLRALIEARAQLSRHSAESSSSEDRWVN